MRSELKYINKNIDSMPFTGIRIIEETIVTCKGNSLCDELFSKTCMLGESREIYYSNLKKWGLTPDKEYIATKIEGYGDVFDIFVINDNNIEESYMSIFFDI